METIQTAVQELLLSLVLGTLALVAAYASFYLSRMTQNLKTQTMALKDEEGRRVLLRALDDVEDLTRTAVAALEQTTAGAIRQAVSQGDMSREALLELGSKAFDALKARITPQTQQVITTHLGSFDAYLKDLLEAEVYRLKQSSSTR